MKNVGTGLLPKGSFAMYQQVVVDIVNLYIER